MSNDHKAKRARTEEKPLEYVWGFGGVLRSEAMPNAIPKGQSNPQRCPYDLYAEKLSGSAFTAPRAKNLQTYLYRIRPSVQHLPFEKTAECPLLVGDFNDKTKAFVDPNQMRWMPMEIPSTPTDFVHGLVTMGGSGSPEGCDGFGIHLYAINESMHNACMMNSDGDFLIVPQLGALTITTEFGILQVEPCEICVIPRGIKFSVAVTTQSRGYILETFARHFTLPELGPIGSQGLANPADFCSPVAAFEDVETEYRVFNKFGGEMFAAKQSFSPFNVVAWVGTYAPFKYDLRRFMCINSVTYDHPDPSIYTVLTCQSDEPGVAVADFVVFPPRWMVQENTFRPPWYHRNCMAEFMGMIWGEYDAKAAKEGKGFVAGGSSLHNWMTAHGPDSVTFDKASTAPLAPAYFDKGLAFMFESKYLMRLTNTALTGTHRDKDYHKCWSQLESKFSNWVPENGDHIASWKKAL